MTSASVRRLVHLMACLCLQIASTIARAQISQQDIESVFSLPEYSISVLDSSYLRYIGCWYQSNGTITSVLAKEHNVFVSWVAENQGNDEQNPHATHDGVCVMFDYDGHRIMDEVLPNDTSVIEIYMSSSEDVVSLVMQHDDVVWTVVRDLVSGTRSEIRAGERVILKPFPSGLQFASLGQRLDSFRRYQCRSSTGDVRILDSGPILDYSADTFVAQDAAHEPVAEPAVLVDVIDNDLLTVTSCETGARLSRTTSDWEEIWARVYSHRPIVSPIDIGYQLVFLPPVPPGHSAGRYEIIAETGRVIGSYSAEVILPAVTDEEMLFGVVASNMIRFEDRRRVWRLIGMKLADGIVRQYGMLLQNRAPQYLGISAGIVFTQHVDSAMSALPRSSGTVFYGISSSDHVEDSPSCLTAYCLPGLWTARKLADGSVLLIGSSSPVLGALDVYILDCAVFAKAGRP